MRFQGKLGAIGLSRRPDLMFKPWGFETLSELVLDYKESYERWQHTLNKIKVSPPSPCSSAEHAPTLGVSLMMLCVACVRFHLRMPPACGAGHVCQGHVGGHGPES